MSLCGIVTKTGQPCKLHTRTTYPCCWIHSRNAARAGTSCAGAKIRGAGPSNVSLRVKPSRIAKAGKGLFVSVPPAAARAAARAGRKPVFKKGDKISLYKGKLLTQKQLDKRYPGDKLARYAINAGRVHGRAVYQDGAGWRSTVARYANDACAKSKTGHCKRTNAVLKVGKKAGKVWLMAKRNLYDGDEIYVEYGTEYWHGGGKAKKAAASKAASASKPAAAAGEYVKRNKKRRNYLSEYDVLMAVRGKKHLQQIVLAKSNARWIVTRDAGVAATGVPQATLKRERKVIARDMYKAIHALYAAGYEHHDLYPRNVTRAVVGGKPVYSLIDYDKMRRVTGKTDMGADLDTLLRRLKIN